MGFQAPKRKGAISEINVTPLVDVMLVLLVIFMISAPLMFSGVNLKLPKTKKVNNLKLNNKQVILSVTASAEYFIGKEKYLVSELIETVQSKFKDYGTDTLYLRADYSLDYGSVAKVMALLKNGGVVNISLVTETEK